MQKIAKQIITVLMILFSIQNVRMPKVVNIGYWAKTRLRILVTYIPHVTDGTFFDF